MLKGGPGTVVSDSLQTFPQFNASLADEFGTSLVENTGNGSDGNASIVNDGIGGRITIEERYLELVSRAYVEMNTYNAALVPKDHLHLICMFDANDGAGGKNHHNATYMRVKKELTDIWFPYRSRYFPSSASLPTSTTTPTSTSTSTS